MSCETIGSLKSQRCCSGRLPYSKLRGCHRIDRLRIFLGFAGLRAGAFVGKDLGNDCIVFSIKLSFIKH